MVVDIHEGLIVAAPANCAVCVFVGIRSENRRNPAVLIVTNQTEFAASLTDGMHTKSLATCHLTMLVVVSAVVQHLQQLQQHTQPQ